MNFVGTRGCGGRGYLMVMEPLSAVDTAWFRMEEAHNPVDIVGVLVFAGALDHGRLRQTLSQRLPRSRRFRQHVQRRWFGRPCWVEDPEWAIDEHLHFQRLPPGAGREALESCVSKIMSESMDLRRPLWDLHVVDNYLDGRSVLVWRLHHAMGDGFALMSLMLAMADGAQELGRDADRSRFEHAQRRLRAIWQRLPRKPRQDAERWLRNAEQSFESLAQLARLSFDPDSLLRGQLSGRRLCAWSEAFPLARIKSIGREMNATVNDVVLTALTGAVRRYLMERGEQLGERAIRAMVPVNLRPPREAVDWDRLGNYFGLVYLELPVQLQDPAARLAALRRSMNQLKASPQAYVTRSMLHVLGFIPTRLSHVIDGIFARKASIVATNVPGPRQPLSFTNERLEEAIFFVPHPASLAVGASILSYAGSVRVGIRSDAAVVDDPRALVRAFEEELAALPGSSTPRATSASSTGSAQGGAPRAPKRNRPASSVS